MTPHIQSLRWTGLMLVTILIVLVPFALGGRQVNDWTVQHLHANVTSSSAAVLVVALLAIDIVLPVPSSFVSTAAGGLLGFLSGLMASVAGMTLCCLAGYGLGRTCGLRLVQRLISVNELDRVAAFWGAHGIWTLVLMRPVPVLAETSVFWAGILRVDGVRFFGVTFAANVVVSAAYSAVGAAVLRFY